MLNHNDFPCCPNGHPMTGPNRPPNARPSTRWACNACRLAFGAARLAERRGEPMPVEQVQALADENHRRIVGEGL